MGCDVMSEMGRDETRQDEMRCIELQRKQLILKDCANEHMSRATESPRGESVSSTPAVKGEWLINYLSCACVVCGELQGKQTKKEEQHKHDTTHSLTFL